MAHPRTELAAPRRPRRSHADRSAATRAKIIAAVTDAITEVGFQRTTATEITQRAGVTWGAVQHHFGGKDGTLLAVLEESFARFAEQVAGVDAAQPLDKRISAFVDRAWMHFDSAHYRSTLEILLHYAGQTDGQPEPWQAVMSAALNGTWQELFGDAAGSHRRSATLQHYTISVLSGLASMRFIGGTSAGAPRAELELLKRTLNEQLNDRPRQRPSTR